MNAITAFVVVALIVLGAVLEPVAGPPASAACIVAAALVALSLKMAKVWERFVILRAGRFMGVRGPGLFWIIPIWDQVTQVIDQRIQTTAFNAEQALTKDTVPVNVDAIVFWRVRDAEKAALEITDYRQAIDRVCQTSLRETIGGTMLTQLLSERRTADEHIRAEIASKITSWGVEVMSVEIRDVAIPVALQDAMSRQAQAERERQARVILGAAEEEVAARFVAAAKTYGQDPTAFQLRAMNIIYETTKERGVTILMPSAMVDAMNPAVALALAGQPPRTGPAASGAAVPPTPRRSPRSAASAAPKS
ncbi:MAG TPA: slipin family protein [Caulobacteraceae bacterium]|nr:slipin family protein [Caulobacteraceae bacterium]